MAMLMSEFREAIFERGIELLRQDLSTAYGSGLSDRVIYLIKRDDRRGSGSLRVRVKNFIGNYDLVTSTSLEHEDRGLLIRYFRLVAAGLSPAVCVGDDVASIIRALDNLWGSVMAETIVEEITTLVHGGQSVSSALHKVVEEHLRYVIASDTV